MIKCSCCGRKAEIRLGYTKTDLCGRCFCRLFENRIKQANRQFRLIRLNQKIAVGISGGKDSAAMLYVLSKMAKTIHGTKLIPVLIDEGIGGYRKNAIKKAKELCKLLHLKLKIYTFKKYFGKDLDAIIKKRDAALLGKKSNDSKSQKNNFERSCTYCGVLRKWALNKAALDLHADALAIGHNADDIAQTFLMNLMHNEPGRLERFSVINEEREGFVKRIKPLIFNLEKECALYCEFKKLPYYRGECPYSKESFRGEIKNLLNNTEEKFPGIKFNLVNSYLDLRERLERANGKSGKPGTVKNFQIPKCAKCGQNSAERTCKACRLLENLKK